MGAEQLARYARAQLEVDFGGTTSDDTITLGAGVLPGELCPLTCGDGGRPAEGQGRRSWFRRSRRRREVSGALMRCRLGLRSPRFGRSLCRRRRGGRCRRPGRPPGAATKFSSCEMAHGGCSGSSRSWRSATANGRVAYGPVEPKDVGELLDKEMSDGARHGSALGETEEIAHLKRQSTLHLCESRGHQHPLSARELRGERRTRGSAPGSRDDASRRS